MENKTKVVFSCILDDVYKEFSMDLEEVKKTTPHLKTDPNVSKMKRKNEKISYLKSMKLLYTITSGKYLDLEEFYDEEDVYFMTFLKEILSKIKITTTFEMKINDIRDWFYSMGRRARSGRVEEYQRQDQLVSHGIKNTEYLNKLGIKVENHRFIMQPSVSIVDKTTMIENKQFIKNGKKRA